MGWIRGDVIVKAEPFAHVLSQQYRGTRCDSCFSCGTDLKRCTSCSVLRYCNRVCQKKDWAVHKEECKCLKRVAPKIPTESVRLMLRLLIRLQHGDDKNLDWDSSKWRKFTDLQSHREEIMRDRKRSEILAQMTFTLQELVIDSVNLPTGQELLEVYGKMVINTYSICDGEMQPIGSGLYISPSLLDHSCVPNAVAVFSGISLAVQCVSDIPSGDPKQVYVSYVDQLAPSVERQRQLEEQYYFTCQCQRCSDKETDSVMLSGACSNINCNGVILPTDGGGYRPCQSCQSTVSDVTYISSIDDVLAESKDVIQKLDDLKTGGDPDIRLQLCKDIMKKQKVLSPYNVYHVKILDRAMDACIDGCHWQQAAEYGEHTIKAYLYTLPPYEDPPTSPHFSLVARQLGFPVRRMIIGGANRTTEVIWRARKLHPPYTPTVGIQLMKLGKLQLYLQQLVKAMVTLQQAESILSVTHGKSHDVYSQLCQLLDQCMEQRRGMIEQTDNG